MPPEVFDTFDRYRLGKPPMIEGVFLRAVVYARRAITCFREAGVAAQFVGVDVVADPNVGLHKRLLCGPTLVRENLR